MRATSGAAAKSRFKSYFLHFLRIKEIHKHISFKTWFQAHINKNIFPEWKGLSNIGE